MIGRTVVTVVHGYDELHPPDLASELPRRFGVVSPTFFVFLAPPLQLYLFDQQQQQQQSQKFQY